MALLPSSVPGPATFPPAMPNSSGFSVSTRSFIWMRVDRSCSGSCAGRRIVPALTRPSASTLSQRAGSNGASGRAPPAVGHVGRRLRQSDVDDGVKLRERVAAEADPGFDLLELDQPGDAAVYGDP